LTPAFLALISLSFRSRIVFTQETHCFCPLEDLTGFENLSGLD